MSATVAVAQLVQQWIVVPPFVGSSPIGHTRSYQPRTVLHAETSIKKESVWREGGTNAAYLLVGKRTRRE